MFKELLNENEASEKDVNDILETISEFMNLLSQYQSKYKGTDMEISCKNALKHTERAMRKLTNIELEADQI